ncbi:MAG: hypothetical protein AAFP70_21010 [Calditrichota bacterium]
MIDHQLPVWVLSINVVGVAALRDGFYLQDVAMWHIELIGLSAKAAAASCTTYRRKSNVVFYHPIGGFTAD